MKNQLKIYENRLSIGLDFQIMWSIAEFPISNVEFFIDWIRLDWHPWFKVIKGIKND